MSLHQWHCRKGQERALRHSCARPLRGREAHQDGEAQASCLMNRYIAAERPLGASCRVTSALSASLVRQMRQNRHRKHAGEARGQALRTTRTHSGHSIQNTQRPRGLRIPTKSFHNTSLYRGPEPEQSKAFQSEDPPAPKKRHPFDESHWNCSEFGDFNLVYDIPLSCRPTKLRLTEAYAAPVRPALAYGFPGGNGQSGFC